MHHGSECNTVCRIPSIEGASIPSDFWEQCQLPGLIQTGSMSVEEHMLGLAGTHLIDCCLVQSQVPSYNFHAAYLPGWFLMVMSESTTPADLDAPQPIIVQFQGRQSSNSRYDDLPQYVHTLIC